MRIINHSSYTVQTIFLRNLKSVSKRETKLALVFLILANYFVLTTCKSVQLGDSFKYGNKLYM